MADINSIACDIIDGPYTGAKTRARQWETEGIDGRAVMSLGKTPGRFAFRCVKIASTAADINTWRVSIEALQNESSYTIVDSSSISHSDCVIETVSEVSPAAINDGSSKFIGTIQITGHFRIT